MHEVRPSKLCLWTLIFAVSCGDSLPTSPDPVGADSADPSPQGAIRINEVMTKNTGSSEDGAGDASDWIELYNAGETAVDLAGWRLSAGGEEATALVLENTKLLPGNFVLIWASGKGVDGAAGELHAAFKLASAGVTVVLHSPDGEEADRLVVPALDDDVSYGLDEPVTEATLLAAGSTGTLMDAPTGDWTAPSFDDAAWHPIILPVGFDGSVTGGEPAERALERPTTQSSDYPGFTGAEAVDGDPNTFSHTGTGDFEPWWQVELDADYAISQVQLVNRYGCCPERLYNIVVSVLAEDGRAVWASDVQNPVAEGEAPVAPDQVITLQVPGGPIGRSVRVAKTAVNGSASSEWLSLADVTVTGTPAAPYSDDITTDIDMWVDSVIIGLRVAFVMVAERPTRAVLTLDYDDGFLASVDGAEVASGNAGAPIEHAAGQPERFPVDLRSLTAGAHLFALRGDNVAANDDDFLIAPTLTAQWFTPGDPGYFTVATPGEPNGEAGKGALAPPTFDPPRGFYSSVQALTVSAPAGATLVYTLDGTPPTDVNGSRLYPASPAAVATLTMDVPTTAIVRAVALRDGWDDSRIATHTYLFLEDVLAQSSRPAGFPSTWESQSEGSYTADYGMDPEVAEDPRYRAELLEGLREIPTLSIVTGIDDLFGANGLYANSASRGDAWERRVSLEWIEPDGSTGFAEDAKLQVHGYGWRYHSSTLKHSFRIQFQAEYGASKLEWPMFADAPVDRFDSIVLRAGGSKTWLDFRDPAQAQYLHDAFARDTARDMGKVDGHATYVHLYLNGLYWGLYMPVERPDAGFAEEYFGGDEANYDAINRRTTTTEAIDGDLEAYNTMIALADGDMTTAEGLAALEAYLDVDDLIDWMLIHQYTTNRDGPCCFEGNNQRGIRKREVGAQYQFFVWDMEYSLWEASDATNVDVNVAGHASHAYRQLWDNAEFRERYSARAHVLLTGAGALTPDAASARYEARADEIYAALLAESARWGDTYRAVPYTRDVEWLEEYNRLQDEYFPYRTDFLIEQLRAVGLYDE